MNPSKIEIEFKNSLKDINVKKIEDLDISKKLKLNRYNLTNGFYAGTVYKYPGSGYIDFHKNNLIILSTRGILAFTENIHEKKVFKQIQNNINDFIDLDVFEKKGYYNNREYTWFSLRDLSIIDNKIYVSYTEEIKKNCFNTSLIYGEFDYKTIEFKKIFSSKECVHTIDNKDKEFVVHQSGGRIVNFGKESVLLTVGDYRSRFLAQDSESVNGKIIKINISTGDYEIISMGHRNPQGLYFDHENNIILTTEHGPMGGDEINLIQVKNITKGNPINFGWPISSAGEHYCSKRAKTPEQKKNCSELYEKYPLNKSHKDHGFTEPLKSFVPSIGISEITKVDKDKYVVSSLNGYSLYFFQLEDSKIVNLERVKVDGRIRDINYNNSYLYLFVEMGSYPYIGAIRLD